MAIHLSPEQERRLQAVTRGAYDSVEGLTYQELTETEFWSSVNQRTDSIVG